MSVLGGHMAGAGIVIHGVKWRTQGSPPTIPPPGSKGWKVGRQSRLGDVAGHCPAPEGSQAIPTKTYQGGAVEKRGRTEIKADETPAAHLRPCNHPAKKSTLRAGRGRATLTDSPLVPCGERQARRRRPACPPRVLISKIIKTEKYLINQCPFTHHREPCRFPPQGTLGAQRCQCSGPCARNGFSGEADGGGAFYLVGWHYETGPHRAEMVGTKPLPKTNHSVGGRPWRSRSDTFEYLVLRRVDISPYSSRLGILTDAKMSKFVCKVPYSLACLAGLSFD